MRANMSKVEGFKVGELSPLLANRPLQGKCYPVNIGNLVKSMGEGTVVNRYNQYRKWKEDCIRELHDKGHLVASNEVVVGEDGSVHFVDKCNTVPDLVTKWEDSKHYVAEES